MGWMLQFGEYQNYFIFCTYSTYIYNIIIIIVRPNKHIYECEINMLY